jgi:hypothetical protein
MFGVHWLTDYLDESDMKVLLKFAEKVHLKDPLIIPKAWLKGDDVPNGYENESKQPLKGFDLDVLKARINNNRPSAEDIKIEYIPFFLQIYLRLINVLNYMKTEGKKNMNFKLRDKKEDKDDLSSPRTIRRLILFSIRLLRDMNMYVNPLFFDDLYYYYYFLQLDKWFDLDSLFRGMNPTREVAEGEKGARLTMRVFEQAASDRDPKKIEYGVDFREQLFNENPARDFDFWLNMIRVCVKTTYSLL